MRRSTCQSWLSWHTDCSPNTYILLKRERRRETKRRTAHTLHCRVSACFFNHIPWSLNRQLPERCCCRNTASITGLSMRYQYSEMRSITLTKIQAQTIWRTYYNAQCVLFGEGAFSKALYLFMVFWVVILEQFKLWMVTFMSLCPLALACLSHFVFLPPVITFLWKYHFSSQSVKAHATPHQIPLDLSVSYFIY